MKRSAEIECCFTSADRSMGGTSCSPNTRKATSRSSTSCLAITVADEQDREHRLWNLPHEVWTLILSFVPQVDRLKHRLVSKAWSNLIDEYSTFKVSYNAVPSHLLNHVLGLRIRGCEFSGARETLLPFTHPLLVREITLGACMTATNTKEILSCCKNVEYLRYFVTEKSDTAFDSDSVLHEAYLKNLRRLKSIEIGILFFGNRNPMSTISSMKTLLGNNNIVYAGLHEIQIHFELSRAEWDVFYSFIRRHSATLCKFGVYRQCICEYDETFNLEDPQVQDRLKVFKECKWKSVTVVRGASYKCRCSGELLWSHLLNDQSHIESLCTDLVPKTELITDFAIKNQHTVCKLNLQDVFLGVDAYMDFSVFNKCTKLQSLSLHFLSCAVIVMTLRMRGTSDEKSDKCHPYIRKFSECSGLEFLPKSLKYLSIKGCDTLSSSLLEMSRTLTNLTELYLGAPGSEPGRLEYGVTMNVFLGFLQNMPNLNHLRIDRSFFNLSAKEEATFMDLQLLNGSDISTAECLDINLSEYPRQSLIDKLNSTLQC